METLTPRARLHDLLADPRSYGKRVLGCLLPALLLMTIYIICGPVDLARYNQSDLTFRASSLLLPCILLGLGGTVAVSLLLAVLRGRVYDRVVTLLFGMGVMSYVQGLMLNINVGSFDGTTIQWPMYMKSGVLNLALWLLVLGVLLVLSHVLGGKWPKLMQFVSAVLAATQIAVLVTGGIGGGEVKTAVLSDEGQFTVSDKNNVVVFSLDCFHNDILDQLLTVYPEIDSRLSDFTRYADTTSRYYKTYPSLIYILTQQEYQAELPTLTYMAQAWSSDTAKTFYGALHDKGIGVGIYVPSAAVMDEALPDVLSGVADNLRYADSPTATLSTVKEMVYLSCYRALPIMLKPFFVVDDAVVNATASASAGVTEPELREGFWPALTAKGLTVEEGSGRFIYQHLRGPHTPYTINADGELSDTATELEQAMGYLRAVMAYIDEMKRLGVYDDATIMITADHGLTECYPIALMLKQPGETHDTMQTSAALVSQSDYLPTFMNAFGLDASAYGTPIGDLDEADQACQRTFSYFAHSEADPPAYRYTDPTHTRTPRERNTMKTILLTGPSTALTERVAQEDVDSVEWMVDTYY